ncbi:MAG: dolichyl-phosphate beta-glucosyltransferase, partial [Acidobacteriota bacterium]
MSLSLIIPAYNEERRLPAFLESIIAFKVTHPQLTTEVIIVDDGSTDTTAEIVRAYLPKISGGRLIQLPKNLGKGAAVQAGVMAAASDKVVFIDADGATPITELPHMNTALDGAQIAIGNRWMKESKAHRSTPLRHLAGWVYKTYMSLFGLGGIDTMCGFKGYRRSVARDLFQHLIDSRWLFDTEIAYKAIRRGYIIKNVPIRWESKEGSKLSGKDLIESALGIW